MQLILRPLSQPELDEIIVNDNLFAIGRHEEPFCGYDSRLVTRLSRRHARLFEQDGAVYLADLGSLNGTTVNGRAVDKIPVRLVPGDELCFAGLCFQIEILGVTPAAGAERPAAAPVSLILRPVRHQDVLEPIAVSQFPFLVNKKSPVFARYSDRFGDQIRYLSRRHAHIFLRHDSLYIEDLGSTNGTYVGGVRLEEHARELRDGDLVAFGGDCFEYRVELVHAAQPAGGGEQAASAALAGEDFTRTTFVTSANSFLDIFCIDDAPAEDESESGAADAAVDAPPEPRAARGWRAPFVRLSSALGEIRNALAEQPGRRRRRWWPAALALVLLGGGATLLYVNTAQQRNIRHLLDQGRYAEAVLAADRYLERHQNDKEVEPLATEALLKAVGPAWIAAVTGGDFAAAERELEQARRLGASQPGSRQLIDAMAWVADMERFIDARGGPQAPLVLFEQEEQIGELLAWWEADPASRRRVLGAIVQELPEFAELRARALSHQRVLQSHKALDLAAIARLRSSVEDRLRSGHAAQLFAELDEFAARYPRIDGEQRLRADLELYLPIEAHIAAGDWLKARQALAQAEFQTPPFAARAALVAETLLPPQEVMERYEAALGAWREGEWERAERLLEGLEKTRWAEPVLRELDRQRQVQGDYAKLLEAKGAADYDERLLAFYTGLDPVRDGWFMDALKGEFELHREKAVARAQQAFEEARTKWDEYRERGGIRGLHRLEAGVSATFRSLAAMLSECYADISHATRLYGLLGAQQPAPWAALYAEVSNEVQLQRRSLSELSMVLEPSLKQAKLGLIPVVQLEQTGVVRPELANDNKPGSRSGSAD